MAEQKRQIHKKMNKQISIAKMAYKFSLAAFAILTLTIVPPFMRLLSGLLRSILPGQAGMLISVSIAFGGFHLGSLIALIAIILALVGLFKEENKRFSILAIVLSLSPIPLALITANLFY